ncbi:MAG: TolC family protein [Nitrospiraceae bacterium]|nr:TolC family protein [Nitrospiraceae bacterium]
MGRKKRKRMSTWKRSICLLFAAYLAAAVAPQPLHAQTPEPRTSGLQTQSPQAVKAIKKGSVLTLGQCMSIALSTNPQTVAARNTFFAAQSRIGEAQSAYYPQAQWQTDINHFSSTTVQNQLVGGTRTNNFANFATGPSITQNIYDFGRTSSQVNSARFNSEASYQSLENVNLQIILNVKTAYYGVLQAQRNVSAAQEVVKQANQHLVQAEGFFKVGTTPKIDVINAEVTLSNAQLSLIQARNALQVSWQNLNNAMGIPDAPEYIIEDNLAYKPYPITFEYALQTAYKNRQDLKSSVSTEKAFEQSLRLANAGFYPTLSGSAGYTWSGDSLPLDHGWNVGASVVIPIFSGFLTKKQVDEATANLNASEANVKVLKQQIYLQNRQAYLNLKQAESSIATAAVGLKQAQENLDLANGRYAAGVGSNIEVTDALTTFSNAQTAYINALYSHKLAEANLENAMGVR